MACGNAESNVLVGAMLADAIGGTECVRESFDKGAELGFGNGFAWIFSIDMKLSVLP